jgi:hypothetical protein
MFSAYKAMITIKAYPKKNPELIIKKDKLLFSGKKLFN